MFLCFLKFSENIFSPTFQQIDCDYDDIGEEVPSMITSSAADDHPKVKHPISASTADADVTVYENINNSCRSEELRHSAVNDHSVTSGHDLYINPLPSIVSKCDGSAEKQNEPTANKQTEHAEGNDSHIEFGTASNPRTLWFGLDVSGTL